MVSLSNHEGADAVSATTSSFDKLRMISTGRGRDCYPASVTTTAPRGVATMVCSY